MPGIRLRHIATILAVLAAVATGAGAEPRPCDDPLFRVEADSPRKHAEICAAAVSARQTVSICGLAQRTQIDILAVHEPVHALGLLLAAFDRDERRIRIVDPEHLRRYLPEDEPYFALPDDVVFRALLTHELAHAILDQALAGRAVPPVDHEYVANALELVALTPDDRKILLKKVGVRAPVTAKELDIFIYGIAPRRFAALSYLFHDAHGCEPIAGILDGTFSFRIQR